MENFLEEYSKLLDESKEHLSYQAIATYLNLKEVLSTKEKSFIENHLKSCSACKEKFDTVYNEDIEMDNEAEKKKLNKNTGTKQWNTFKIFRISSYTRYAAAAVILIVVTATLYFYLSSKDDMALTQDLQEGDSIIVNEGKGIDLLVDKDSAEVNKPVPEEFIAEDLSLAESYRNNRVLDNFINRNVRSETIVQVISPSIADTLNEPISFKWTQPEGINLFTLILLDNKNKTIYKKNIDGNQITYSGILKPGLYYWKIESNGKLEAVGKFYIE